MNTEQRAYWQAYVDALRGPLRLKDWTVTIIDDPGDDGEIASGAGAAIRAANKRLDADLVLGRDWPSFTDEQRREYLTHELMHLHLWRLMTYAQSLADRLGEEAKQMAYEQINTCLELGNDEIARAFAPFLPLPPKPKKERA